MRPPGGRWTMLVTTPRAESSFKIWMRNSPVAPGISNGAAETLSAANRIASSAMDLFPSLLRPAANAVAGVAVAHRLAHTFAHRNLGSTAAEGPFPPVLESVMGIRFR